MSMGVNFTAFDSDKHCRIIVANVTQLMTVDTLDIYSVLLIQYALNLNKLWKLIMMMKIQL